MTPLISQRCVIATPVKAVSHAEQRNPSGLFCAWIVELLKLKKRQCPFSVCKKGNYEGKGDLMI